MSHSPFNTNTKTVAAYRGVDDRTIQRHCRENKIPAVFRHGRWWINSDWFENEKRMDKARLAKN